MKNYIHIIFIMCFLQPLKAQFLQKLAYKEYQASFYTHFVKGNAGAGLQVGTYFQRVNTLRVGLFADFSLSGSPGSMKDSIAAAPNYFQIKTTAMHLFLRRSKFRPLLGANLGLLYSKKSISVNFALKMGARYYLSRTLAFCFDYDIMLLKKKSMHSLGFGLNYYLDK